MEVLRGVSMVDGVNGHVYVVEGGDKAVLVDTGMPRSLPRIERFLAGSGLGGGDIEYVVLTHCHVDHVGSAAEAKRRLGAKLLIGQGDVDYVSGKAKLPPPRGAAGLGFRLFGWAVGFEWFTPDGVLKEGESIGTLKVIHTPGHTPGSICLFDQKTKTLFSGDSLLCGGDGLSLKPPSRSFSLDPDQALASLRKLLEYDMENVCPGHGRPVVGGAGAKLRALLGAAGKQG